MKEEEEKKSMAKGGGKVSLRLLLLAAAAVFSDLFPIQIMFDGNATCVGYRLDAADGAKRY